MLERVAEMLAAGLTVRDIAVTLGVREQQILELIRPPGKPVQRMEGR